MAAIVKCPRCGKSIHEPASAVPAAGDAPEFGDRPECGDLSPEWVNVARVVNLAEAGFLSDDLGGLGIDARVVQTDEFSGIGGHWTTSYMIQVPPAAARSAAAQIRRYVENDAPDRKLGVERYDVGNAAPIPDFAAWRPVVIFVLAGVVCFVAGRHTGLPQPRLRPPEEQPAAAMEANGGPLFSEPAPGEPRHRLMFDSQLGQWILDTDLNLDGSYEHRQFFQKADDSQ
jgi:hypothetical protein